MTAYRRVDELRADCLYDWISSGPNEYEKLLPFEQKNYNFQYVKPGGKAATSDQLRVSPNAGSKQREKKRFLQAQQPLYQHFHREL